MSARQKGSWQQFRAAVEELQVNEEGDSADQDDNKTDPIELSIYQTLRFNFERLGHAEFFSGAGDAQWRVTPPTLAITEHAWGGRGIVIGARSLRLLQSLALAVKHTGAKMEVNVIPGYPDQIAVSAASEAALVVVAKQIRIHFQCDAPAAILLSLPPISDSRVRQAAQLPFGAGWKVSRFSTGTLGWQPSTVEDAANASSGLFRFIFRHQRYVFFCERNTPFRIPVQVGKYLAIRSDRHPRRVLRYNPQTRIFSMPAACRPPFLIERALIACSGSPPSYRDGNLLYTEIPQNIAAITAALLCQDLR